MTTIAAASSNRTRMIAAAISTQTSWLTQAFGSVGTVAAAVTIPADFFRQRVGDPVFTLASA
jgi:hypothetical protein